MTPHPTDADAPAANRLKLDAQGRAIPRTDEERAAQRRALRELFARWEASPVEDPPGETEAFMRAIDAERPERPLFEGYY